MQTFWAKYAYTDNPIMAQSVTRKTIAGLFSIPVTACTYNIAFRLIV